MSADLFSSPSIFQLIKCSMLIVIVLVEKVKRTNSKVEYFGSKSVKTREDSNIAAYRVGYRLSNFNDIFSSQVFEYIFENLDYEFENQ